MNYCELKTHDIANGPGVRVSLFVSGCRHHCKGCFQPETWDFNYGKPFTGHTTMDILNAMHPEWISGITILGGDPMEPENRDTLCGVLAIVKTAYPEKSVWVYTGCLYDEVEDYPIIDFIDVLIDGEFHEDEKDVSLQFRGSSNQRIIDIKKTRENGKIVLWEDEEI